MASLPKWVFAICDRHEQMAGTRSLRISHSRSTLFNITCADAKFLSV
ncbi:hypothetical protein [Nostoc sp.]